MKMKKQKISSKTNSSAKVKGVSAKNMNFSDKKVFNRQLKYNRQQQKYYKKNQKIANQHQVDLAKQSASTGKMVARELGTTIRTIAPAKLVMNSRDNRLMDNLINSVGTVEDQAKSGDNTNQSYDGSNNGFPQ